MNAYATNSLVERQASGADVDEDMKRGIAASEAGDKAAAERIFRDILAGAPGTPEAWVWLGWTSANLDDAEAAFRRAAEIDPGNEEATLGLRWVASRREPAAAEETPPRRSYQTVQLDPHILSSPISTRTLDTGAMQDTRLSADASSIVSGLSLDEAMQKGIAAAQSGDRGLANAIFKEVTARHPGVSTPWVWVGGTSANLDDAEAAFRRAAEIDADDKEAHLGLRWVSLRRRALSESKVAAAPPAPAPDRTLPARPAASTHTREEKKLSPFARLLKKLRISLLGLVGIVLLVAVLVTMLVWFMVSS